MALGARSEQVVWTVTREVAVLVGVGTGVGLFLALLAILTMRGVTAPAPGISFYRPTADPARMLLIAAFMAVVALAAAFVPARRAARWIRSWRFAATDARRAIASTSSKGPARAFTRAIPIDWPGSNVKHVSSRHPM